jgi:polyisoprenoid-binding protein YceI
MQICKPQFVAVIGPLLLSSALWAADTHSPIPFDTEKSVMTVRVLKSGFFSAFGHEHQVSAPIRQGSFRVDDPAVELAVDSRQLQVVDKDVSEKDRAEIQQTMLGPKVLDSQQFPEIRFRSTRVDRLGDGKWVVFGDLTLHGQTHPIKVAVERDSEHYRGSAEVKQRDFGITPVTVAGGTVKVKDEVRVEFKIVGRP